MTKPGGGTSLALLLILCLFLFAIMALISKYAIAATTAKSEKTTETKKFTKNAKPTTVAKSSDSEDWRTERVYGDIVLSKKKAAMKEAEVEAVLFPHWFHRIRFRCKVCHEDVFQSDEGSNTIDMDQISEGKLCGTCHNGSIAPEPLECEICHSYPWALVEAEAEPESGQLDAVDPMDLLFAGKSGKIAGRGDLKKLVSSAAKWGSGWQPRAFGIPGLPKDKYGLIDWIKITKSGMLLPKGSIDPSDPSYESPVHYQFDEDGEEDIEDILISVKSEKQVDVVFPHTLHAWWLNCSSCHPHRFVRTVGDTKMTMKEIGKGKYCGECHGTVAFPLEDCRKCHDRETVEACKKDDNCISSD